MNTDPNLTARALGENLPDHPPVLPSPEAELEMAAIRDLGSELQDALRLQQNHDFDLGEFRTLALEAVLQSARTSRPVTFLRTAGWVSLGAAAAVALGFFVRVDSPTGSTPLAEAVYDPFFALESLSRAHPAIAENPLRSIRSPGIDNPLDLQTPLRPPQIADFRLADAGFSLRNLPPLPESPMLREFTQSAGNFSSLVLVELDDSETERPIFGASLNSSGGNAFTRPTLSQIDWIDPVVTPFIKLNFKSKNKTAYSREESNSTQNIAYGRKLVNTLPVVSYTSNYSENNEIISISLPSTSGGAEAHSAVLEMNPRIVQQYQVTSHEIRSDGSHEISVNFKRRSSDPRRLDAPDLRYQLRSARLTREARSSEAGCLSLVDARNQLIEMIPLQVESR